MKTIARESVHPERNGNWADPGEPFFVLWMAFCLSILICSKLKLFSSGRADSEAAAITGHTLHAQIHCLPNRWDDAKDCFGKHSKVASSSERQGSLHLLLQHMLCFSDCNKPQWTRTESLAAIFRVDGKFSPGWSSQNGNLNHSIAISKNKLIKNNKGQPDGMLEVPQQFLDSQDAKLTFASLRNTSLLPDADVHSSELRVMCFCNLNPRSCRILCLYSTLLPWFVCVCVLCILKDNWGFFQLPHWDKSTGLLYLKKI